MVDNQHDTTKPDAIESWLEGNLPGYRFGVVLILLLDDVRRSWRAAPTATWVRVVTTTLQGLTLLAAFRASQVSRRLFRLAALVVARRAPRRRSGHCLFNSSSDASGAFDLVSVLMVGAAPIAIARAL